MMLSLAPFSDRSNFAPWLNEQGLVGMAVEVGTHQGEFADQFLSMWQGEKLYCVDPWLSGYDPKDPASTGDRSLDRKMAEARLARHSSRAIIDPKTSVQAARCWHDETFDFVYVDGCHKRASVTEDLMIWWPKIKTGGVLAGHDFFNITHQEETQPAVLHFAALVERELFLVPDLAWSYYMVK